MKDLLQSLIALSEGETKETGKGRVHKGTYGTEYETDKDGNEKKKEQPAAEKKGRGRPKKAENDDTKKFDSSALNNVFGGKKPSKEVGKVSKKHSLKEYMEAAEQALNEAEQVTIAPAQQNTQVIKQGDQTLGTVTNPSLAATIKNAISKGEMSLAGDELTEKDEGKPGKNFAKIAKKAGEKYGSKAAGERVAGAVRAKLAAQGKLEESDKANKDYDGDGKIESGKDEHKGAVTKAINKALGKDVKKDVKESRDFTTSEYLDEEVAKILAREKPGMSTVKSNDEFYSAVYHELIQMGLTPKAARYKVSYDEDFISDVASAYNHYQQNPSLDEGSYDDVANVATDTFTEPGSPMTQPRGQVAAPVAKPEPTAWSRDPIAAASDRAFDFVSSLKKKSPFSESTDMKDIQLEGWEKQLQGLLNEGLTVSSSTGQQGQPNSVTVSATEGDADQLMQVLRSAGIGGFGAEQPAPEIGYGVAQGGEEEPTGTGTEPQPSPEVVGDGDDMLALIKKLTGMGGDAEVVAIGSDEEGQDYEDEEGSEEQSQTLEPADGGEEEGSEEQDSEEGSEESDDEEKTDEGNMFTGNLAKARENGESEADLDGDGDMEKVHEGEHTCNECGMLESECECDHEQVEENFANSSNDPAEQELMKLKALLSMGGDLHKQKRSQAIGNPTQVSVAEAINDWKKLSGIK